MKLKKGSMETSLLELGYQIRNSPHKYPKEAQWIAPEGRKCGGVKYVSYIGSTGYADAAKGYLRSLVEAGVYVLFEVAECCHGKDNTLFTDDDLVLATSLCNKHINYDSVIIHTLPTHWVRIAERERSHNPNVKIYGLTVWETDRVYPKWMEMISQARLTGLIVPSEWNRDIFIKSTKLCRAPYFPPVHVCHHAITDRIFAPSSKSNDSYTREDLFGPSVRLALLCIGTWTPRKGVAETVKAYLKAFDGHRDVVLYLKTSLGKYSKQNSQILHQRLNDLVKTCNKPPKILIDTELRSDEYINCLTKHCDAYMSLCNSEGVGLGACYAALHGKIIVMTGYGGQVEYIPHVNWIQYNLDDVNVPSNFVEWIKPPQKWAFPNLTHAVEYLKYTYNNRDACLQEAKLNRQAILTNFSYNKIGQQFVNILGSRLQQPMQYVAPSPVYVSEFSVVKKDKKDKKDKKKKSKRSKSKDKKKKKH